jgi:hypothetical protein
MVRASRNSECPSVVKRLWKEPARMTRAWDLARTSSRACENTLREDETPVPDRATGGRQRTTVMTAEQPGYLAYMLRMWRVEAEEGTVWRASVESPHTGERDGFANLEVLFAFLEEKTGQMA